MSFLGRIWRSISQRIDNSIREKEDPETILVETILETEEQLVELRRAVAGAIAAQRNIARQLDKDRAKAKQWHDRARLALQGGNEKLAKEALQRRQPYQNSVQKLQSEIDKQKEIVSRIKQDLLTLETKIGLAKVEKNTYLIRAKSAFLRQKKSQSIYESDSASILSEIEARAIESEAYSQLISNKDYDEY